MEEEFMAIRQNETCDMMPIPNEVKPISCKMGLQSKKMSNGSIESYKDRLIARGFSQQYGLDNDETSSPVAKITTI